MEYIVIDFKSQMGNNPQQIAISDGSKGCLSRISFLCMVGKSRCIKGDEMIIGALSCYCYYGVEIIDRNVMYCKLK